jgi:hypothetical protein
MNTTTPHLQLGRIVATPGALRPMQDAGIHPLRLLKRHAHGDWGDLHQNDIHANHRALRRGMRVLSAYVLDTGERIWIITEANRSATTLLLPEEY